MQISRRGFLKLSAVGVSVLGFDLEPARAATRQLKIRNGTLCPKGASQMQRAISPRLQKGPKLRRAGATEWEEVDWDFAMDWFAHKFKESRDRTFVEKDYEGRTVNRCEGIAWVGSATVANEDAYLITKTMRALGRIYIDHQARI